MRTVLSWSYRQLDPTAARTLRLVSLHPGADFDAYAVAALTRTDLARARRMIDRLARAYLVHPIAPERFELHDLLRGFTRELAEAEDDAEARHDALAALFELYLHGASAAMNLLFPAEAARRPEIAGPPRTHLPPLRTPEAARAWLDAERANLIAAVAHAETDETAQRLEARAIELAALLERHLNFGHHHADATTIHRSALRTARRSGDRSAEATALTHLGFIEWERGRYRQAADYQRQALALFRSLGDQFGQARTLHRLALVEKITGHYEQAREHCGLVLTLCRKRGEQLGQARALHALGCLDSAQGRYPRAQNYLRESLALLEELSDQRSRSVTLKELGVIELRYGRLAAATEFFGEAVALCQDAGNRSGEAEAVSQLGLVQLRHGRPEAAIEHQERAITLFREIADGHGEAHGAVPLRGGRICTPVAPARDRTAGAGAARRHDPRRATAASHSSQRPR